MTIDYVDHFQPKIADIRAGGRCRIFVDSERLPRSSPQVRRQTQDVSG
jgi:hypothetical protein